MGDRKADPRTVFVRGVDASMSDAQLQELFGEVGPVKHAFLVRKGGKDGAHRGFGFVQFAVTEDAERAAADLNGKEFAGRKLKIEGAVKRAPLEERKKRKQDAAAAPAAEQQEGGADGGAAAPAPAEAPPAKKQRPAPKPRNAAAVEAAHLKHKWLRAVAVGGLTADTVEAAVGMARAAGQVEEVVRPVPDKFAAQFMLKRDGCTGEAFIAVYKSIKEALAAVAALHGQTAKAKGKGKKGGGGGGAAAGGGDGGCRLWARQLSGEGLHHKRWRLIVRNLPFTATEADLRPAFTPAGFVWELTLPRSASGRGRGFAFVGFTCKAHAERAIKLVNGQTLAGRPVAVDWAVAKAQFDAKAASDAAEAGEDAAAAAAPTPRQQAGIDGLDDSDSEDEAAGGGAALGQEEDGGYAAAPALAPDQERRMLTSVIDNILDDDSEEEEEGSEEEEEESGDEEMSGSEGEEEEDEMSGSEGDDMAGGSSDEEGEGDEEEEAGGTAAPAAPADPFSRKQLQQKAAAAAAAAATPQDAQQPARPPPEEGATVFIRGLPLDVSKEQVFLKLKAFGAVRSCRLVMDKDSGKPKGTAFVDFYRRASAQAAADACAKGRLKEGPGVVVGGRVAEVDMALAGDDVRALALAKAKDNGPRDSRRMGLAKEGQIAEGSAAWEDMSAGDQAKRKRAAEEKKLKLKSPNFVVSDTRLSVRNVPHVWTEKQLKQAFIAAVKERAKQAQPVVKQAKILVDEERTNADGTPRSKGIGFVEFAEHEHALCALRQLNNNPSAFNKERRPIVEFALENVKALKFREAKLAQAKQPQQQAQQGGGDGGGAGGEAAPAAQQRGAAAAGQRQEDGGEGGEQAPKSKRQQRREVKLMLRERKREATQEKAAAAAAAAKGSGPAAEGAAAAANGTPSGGAEEKSKAAKRREQRKRKEMEAKGIAPPPVAAATPVAAKQQQLKQQQPKQQQGKQQGTPKQQHATPQQQQGKQQPQQRGAAQQPKQQQPKQQQPKQQQQQEQQGKQQPEGKQQQGKQQALGKQQQGKQLQQQQARRLGVNSQAHKSVAASQQEQQAHRRKRSADDLIDRLADGPQGTMQNKKPRKKEQTDSVDALAKQYLAKFFDGKPAGGGGGKAGRGGKAGGGAKPAAAAAAAAMKRWFE